MLYSIAWFSSSVFTTRATVERFWPIGDINTEDAEALLIDDGIDGNGGLAGLPVTDDQLALAATDRNHRVDGLDAGLQRFANRLTGVHAGSDDFDT